MKKPRGYVSDFYDLLGIKPSASSDEIKRAYRRLARKYHPDVSKVPDAEERFKEVQQAYSTLKDPLERRYYDQVLDKAKVQPNFEPDRDAYRYWQSPPPPRKSFARKAIHWLIVLFWMFTGMGARVGRMAAVYSLTIALAVFHSVFPVVAIVLIVAGLIFEGNPFRLATWSTHPQLTFLCFGFPVVALMVTAVVYQFTEWLAQDGPLFPFLQNKINALRYRTLCF